MSPTPKTQVPGSFEYVSNCWDGLVNHCLTTINKCEQQSKSWGLKAYAFKVRKRRGAIQGRDLATTLEIRCRKPRVHLEQIAESLR
jgi:hypothetical protein